MSTDAVYKSGLPYGITAGVLSHFMIPKRLGPIKSVLTVVLSFSSYISGKMLYSPLCKEKVFGSGNVFANKPQERRYYLIYMYIWYTTLIFICYKTD